MVTTLITWALWIQGGGQVNSGYLSQPYISAYFSSQEDCDRIRLAIDWQKTGRCIDAHYISIDALTKIVPDLPKVPPALKAEIPMKGELPTCKEKPSPIILMPNILGEKK